MTPRPLKLRPKKKFSPKNEKSDEEETGGGTTVQSGATGLEQLEMGAARIRVDDKKNY